MTTPVVPPELKATVKEAGLRYVSDTQPGISREKAGKDFRYRAPGGKLLRDAETLARVRRLAIPPAWTDVWICVLPNGHIQATGRDQRGRKQYRYHEAWREVRDGAKYERTMAFGRALPRIRQRVARDLRRPGLGREKLLAAMIRLLETTLIRVGNEEYAQQNHSFGLSTMRDRHVKVRGGNMHFDFRGKSGKHHSIDLHAPRLARIVRAAQELPGQDLFQYLDENGEIQKIASDDVNDYLREVAGEEFSAKDFRTWAGTVLAAIALRGLEPPGSGRQAKQNILRAIESVAEKLGNTPSICRKCYVHPAVLQSYLEGETLDVIESHARQALKRTAGLRDEEVLVLQFLQRQLKRPRKSVAELLHGSLRKIKQVSRASTGSK